LVINYIYIYIYIYIYTYFLFFSQTWKEYLDSLEGLIYWCWKQWNLCMKNYPFDKQLRRIQAFYQSFIYYFTIFFVLSYRDFERIIIRNAGRLLIEVSKWARRASGGSIIVRRLICLLYTAGGLLSGIPFYGIPTLYIEPACDGGEKPSCERDTCCYITSPIVAAQPRHSAESGAIRFRLVRDEHGEHHGEF